jgi:hypothetical protein
MNDMMINQWWGGWFPGRQWAVGQPSRKTLNDHYKMPDSPKPEAQPTKTNPPLNPLQPLSPFLHNGTIKNT